MCYVELLSICKRSSSPDRNSYTFPDLQDEGCCLEEVGNETRDGFHRSASPQHSWGTVSNNAGHFSSKLLLLGSWAGLPSSYGTK